MPARDRSRPARRVPRSPAMTRSGAISASGTQHEGALEQARVRQGQLGVRQNEVVIGEEVDVERARAPAPLGCAVAAERALDRLRALEQRARREHRSRRRCTD